MDSPFYICPTCGKINTKCNCGKKGPSVYDPLGSLGKKGPLEFVPGPPIDLGLTNPTDKFRSFNPVSKTVFGRFGEVTGRIEGPFDEIKDILGNNTGFKLEGSRLTEIRHPKIDNPFIKGDPDDPTGFGGGGGWTPP